MDRAAARSRRTRVLDVFARVAAAPTAAAVVLAALLISPARVAADDVERELWMDYNPTWHVTGRWDAWGDLGFRTTFDAPRFYRFIIRPNARYYWQQWQLEAGLANFLTIVEDEDNAWEIRPWQGAEVTWPKTKVPLHHHWRLEERFTLNSDTTNTFALRFRYRLAYDIQWTNPEKGRYWRTPLSVEGFLTITGTDDRWSEETRVTAGLDYVMGPLWTAGVEFTWEKPAAPLAGVPADVVFLRLRLYQTFR